MTFFCSKDCPDLCAVKIGSLTPRFSAEGLPQPWSDPGFVCAKFKTFAQREIANGQDSWQGNWDQRNEFQTPTAAITALSSFLEPYRKKKILFLRGSGSLGYKMSCWDELFSRFGNCYNVSGGPCDDTGEAAHVADFGVAANPDIMDLQQADSIILYGKNAAATSPHFYAFLKQLKEQGKLLIYIDPIRTKTAELAHHYIQINPGCDGLLACALLATLGLEPGYSPEALCATAGISAEQLQFLSTTISQTKTAHVQGSGLQRQSNGMNAFQWINKLAYKTGRQDLLFWTHGSKRLWQKPRLSFAGSIHIDKLAQSLANNEFDLFVCVAANPVMTYPDSLLWQQGMRQTPSLVIGTNHDETARCANFFLKVGGMFAQSDFMGSYFFPHHCSRTNATQEMGDVAAASSLAQSLKIPLHIPELAQTPKCEVPPRTYRHPTLSLTVPVTTPRLQLITSSHHSYLNSQTLPGMEQGLQVVYINPVDAATHAIKDGEDVRVIGDCGDFVAAAMLTEDVPAGCLMCWKNIHMKQGYCNNAIPPRLTDSGTGLAYYAAYVEVVKIS